MTPPANPAPPAETARPSGEALSLIRGGVHLIALRELRDPIAAEDVAQESVARLLDALSRRAREIDDLPAFARGIARHLIADARHTDSCRRSIDAVEGSVAHAVHVDPLAETVRGEERRRMATAVAMLEPEDRELLRALYVGNVTPGELADKLGEPPERIRKRKSRALERLRAAFFGHDRRRTPTGGGTPTKGNP